MISHRRFAELSLEAYTKLATVTRSDIHFVVSEIDGEVVVAFRGTVLSDLADVVRDIQIADRTDPAVGHVHSGFWFGASYVVLDVALAVHGRRFHLTGHSLGGALALLVGAMLTARGVKPASIVTFGAPRVGYFDFVKALDGLDITLYRKGNDVVPSVPFYTPLTPYEHPRGLREIGSALEALVNVKDHACLGYVNCFPAEAAA